MTVQEESQIGEIIKRVSVDISQDSKLVNDTNLSTQVLAAVENVIVSSDEKNYPPLDEYTFRDLGSAVDAISSSVNQNEDLESNVADARYTLFNDGINRVQGSLKANINNVAQTKFEFENFSMGI